MSNNYILKHIAQDLIARNIQQEYIFSASRSGGAGGQNVNKVNTKVELRFCVCASAILTFDEKAMVAEFLCNRLNANGELVITSTKTRSQFKNKELCAEKLTLIIAKALVPKVERVSTRPTKAANEKRLTQKKQRAQIKAGRKKFDE